MNIRQICLFLIFTSMIWSCSGDPSCLACNGTICTICAGGYSDITANLTCRSPLYTLDNCYSYYAEAFCQICAFGSFYDSYMGTCTPFDATLISNCLYSSVSRSVCTVCGNGILATEGSCNVPKKCSDPNCQACHYETQTKIDTCLICAKNYVLLTASDSKLCVSQTSVTLNCALADLSFNCASCNYGYYLNNGMCLHSKLTNMFLARSGRILLGVLEILALMMNLNL